MGKQSGLGDNFYISGHDLSGDVGSVDQISGPLATLNVTPVNSFGNQRIGGLRDGSMQFTSFFNAAAGAEHPVLSALPRTDVIASYFRGTTLGNASACINGKQVNYDPTRDATGNLTLKVEVQANSFGLEWGLMLTAGLRTDTTATNGTALDNAALTSFGAQAYLQVTAITGTSVDILVQHSADNSTWATLIDFGSQAAAGAARGTSTGTVNRYLRAITGTGTFSSVTFAVTLVRNVVAVSF